MRLAGVDATRAIAAPRVLSRIDNLQMLRIDAAPNAAEMVKFHPNRNRRSVELVSDAMRWHGNPTDSHPRVAIGFAAKVPQPASCIGLRCPLRVEPSPDSAEVEVSHGPTAHMAFTSSTALG